MLCLLWFVLYTAAPFLQKAVNDSNASCADTALDAVLAYAEYCTDINGIKLTAETVAPDIISKGFSSRPAVIAKAESTLLKFMEVSAYDDIYFLCTVTITCIHREFCICI
jgi:hypothetical protein